MRVNHWFGAAVALFFLFCALTSPDGYGQRFDQHPTHGGRTLTEDEFFTLQSAMVNILLPPPDCLRFADENGDSHTVRCLDIGLDLLEQLRGGRIEAETVAAGNWTNPDGNTSPEGDGMNADPGLVGAADQADSNKRVLEGVLVHEWGHKKQDSTSLADTSGREIGPYSLMHAYYCSTGVDCTDTNDWLPKWAADQLATRKKEYEEHHLVRDGLAQRVGNHFVFLNCDTSDGGQDSVTSIDISGSDRHSFPLFPMCCSDFYVIEDHPMLPPEHDLVVICGGVPLAGIAQIQLLDMFEGQIIAPVWSYDFGPSMYFFSMERSEMVHFWYVVDTLNHQILYMQDALFNDGVPDEIVSIFAHEAWPGFEPLHGMLGLDKATHPFIGSGLLVNMSDAHHYEMLFPYDQQFFIVDADGNLQADFMMPLPLYQFLRPLPAVQVVPWIGDVFLPLFGTWEHDIAVWTSDPTGELLFEQLGMVHMAPGVEMMCPLIRPLLPGEFIMAMDMQTEKRTGPKQTIDPTPQNLVITYNPAEETLEFWWDVVVGAEYYQLWCSDDGLGWTECVDHPPVPARTCRTTCREMHPARETGKEFFRVTAGR